MGGAIPVRRLGKIFLIVICIVYILVGILLFIASVIYLKQGFGIGDEGYARVQHECKQENISELMAKTENCTEWICSYCCDCVAPTLGAICFALILAVLLVAAGIFLLVMVFKGLCVRRWYLIWFIIALVLAILSLGLFIWLILVTFSDGIGRACQRRHNQYNDTYNRPLNPPCGKPENFVTYRDYPECFRSWRKFENFLKRIWRMILVLLFFVLLLNVLALIAFFIIYLCCRKRTGPGTELTVLNLPPNITEKDLKKKFPGALGVSIDKNTGTARVVFPNPDQMKRGVKDSGLLRIGPTKVSWLRPEELYVVDVDPDMSASDLLQEFPGAKSVKFQNATEPDTRIATVIFPNEAGQKKAYTNSTRKKVGPQQLDGGFSSGGEADKQLQISNVPSDVNEESLKKRFPNATGVKIDKGTGIARVQFDDAGAAKKAYDDSDMLKLGKPKLGYLRPEELYLVGIPTSVTDKDLLKEFPTAKGVKFQKGEGGQRIATVIFPNEAEQKKAYDSSKRKKVGPQQLDGGGFGSGGGDKELQISNLSSDVTEESLRKRFPNATGVKIDKGTGIAKVQFDDAGAAKKAYDDSDMLKLGKYPPKLGYRRPEELYLVGVPPSVTDKDLFKEFPTAIGVKFQNGEGGQRIATVIFPNEAEQKKAYGSSKRKKVGPQQLDGGFGSGAGGGVGGGDKELQISNLPSDVTEESLKKQFPYATGVKIDKSTGIARVQFDDAGAAKKAYDDSGMLKLGRNKLGYLRPEEFYVVGVPASVTDKDLLKDFPTAKGVKFQVAEGGTRIATLIFPTDGEQKKAYADSSWTKLAPQKLGYGGGKGKSKKPDETESADIEESGDLSDDELAKKLWKTPDATFSNISNLFHPKLYVLNVPKGTTRKQLLDIFEAAEKVDIKGKVGVLEFENPQAAAHAFHVSQKKTLNGQKLHVSIHEPKPKKRKKSSQSVKSRKSGMSGRMSSGRMSRQSRKSDFSRISRKSKRNAIGPS